MGNHRADRRGPGRRPSDLSTPVAELDTHSLIIAEAETVVIPVTVPGKRRAEKPGKPAKPAKVQKAARTAKPAKVQPITRSHAAVKVQVVEKTRTEPARRANRHSSSRGPLFRLLPSPPLVLGVAALAISAGGALTAANGGLSDHPARFNQASALSGASDVSRVNLAGQKTISRSADRSSSDSTDAASDADVEAELEEHTEAVAKLYSEADQTSARLARNQWQLPVAGYHLTATFGEYGLWSSYHTGLDFAADPGTPIHAVANGVVTSAGYDGAYGNKTVITLDDGTELWFCHQTTINVSVGDEVHGGDLIGTVGSTGHVTGPHLHLEVRPGAGDPVDPYAALVAHGVTP